MKRPDFLSRANLSCLIVLCVALVANFAYEYKEYANNYRTVDSGRINAAGRIVYSAVLDAPVIDVPVPVVTMAGFPAKFYVRTDFLGTPSVSRLAWLPAGMNLAFWGALALVVLGYERWMGKRYSKEESGTRQVGLADLLVAISIIGVVFAYWNQLERRIATQGEDIAKIKASGGQVGTSILVPSLIGEYLPGWFRSRYTRVSFVRFSNSSPEIVELVCAQPMLRELRIAGGNYPDELIDRFAGMPLLWQLRLSGRKLTPQNIASLRRLSDQLVVLNLMRTNITAAGMESLGAMPRLAELTLTHTDVDLSELASPSWSQSVKYVALPHPKAGRSDSLAIQGWPELEILEISEWDELKNDSALAVTLGDMPKLETVRLDPLQKFDLSLHNLPSLRTVSECWLQPETRVGRKQDIPAAIWVEDIKLSGLPVLESFSVWGPGIKAVEVEGAPKLRMVFTTRYYREIVAREPYQDVMMGRGQQEKPPSDVDLATRQSWVDSLGECDGPLLVSFSGVDMRDVDFSPLKNNAGLKVLNLPNTDISSELAGVAGAASIRELSLVGLPMDGKQISWMVSKLPGLTHLHCDKLGVTKLRLNDIERLVQVFGESGGVLGSLQALELTKLPKFKESIDLFSNMIYCKVQDAPSLVGFSFRSPLPEASQLSGFRDLQYFAGGGEIVDDALVLELAECKKLKHISLSYAAASAEALLKLGNLSELETVSLVGCQVNDTVLARLAKNPNLKELVLDGTQVTTQSIAKILGLKSLLRLSINGTPAVKGDLSGLVGIEELKHLGIAGARLTAPLAVTLSKMMLLESLDLSGSEIVPAGLAQLAKKPPMGLGTLILRDVDAPDLSVRLLDDLVKNLDITNSYFEPNSMDRFVGARGLVDTQQQAMYMASISASPFASSYRDSVEIPKAWEVFPGAFNPNAPKQPQGQYGVWGSGGIQVVPGRYQGSSATYRVESFDSQVNGFESYGGESYSSDRSALSMFAEQIGFAMGLYWGSGGTTSEY